MGPERYFCCDLSLNILFSSSVLIDRGLHVDIIAQQCRKLSNISCTVLGYLKNQPDEYFNIK